MNFYVIPGLKHQGISAPQRLELLKSRKISLDWLSVLICGYYDITVKELKSKDRHARIVEARHIFCYVSRLCTTHSLLEIGRFLNRDHTTVIHAVQQVRTHSQMEEQFKEHLTDIEHAVYHQSSRLISTPVDY